MLNQVILNALDVILISNFNDLLPQNLPFLIRGASEQLTVGRGLFSYFDFVILLFRFLMSLQL